MEFSILLHWPSSSSEENQSFDHGGCFSNRGQQRRLLAIQHKVPSPPPSVCTPRASTPFAFPASSTSLTRTTTASSPLKELSRALALLVLDADHSDLESILQSYIKLGSNGLWFDDFVPPQPNRSTRPSSEGGGAGSPLREDADLSETFKAFDEDGNWFHLHLPQSVLATLVDSRRNLSEAE